MSLIQLLTNPNKLPGYNFTRTLFVMGYTEVYRDNLQKRVHIGEEVSPFLFLMAEATK